MKPHDPSTLEFAREVAEVVGVAGVNAVVVDVDYGAIEATVDTLGGSIHSIDQAVCGERLVGESATPQD